MNCPICSQPLVSKGNTFVCPNKHGLLIDGGQLHYLRQNTDVTRDGTVNGPSDSTTHQLSCPNCSNSMQKVDYVGSGVIIDSCTHCAYRWLDKGELEKVLRRQLPKLNPEDALLLRDIESKDKMTKNLKPNENIAFFTLYRVVYVGLTGFFGPDPGRSMRFITAIGLRGVIGMLLHSWFYRILLAIIVIIFGLLAYYMIREFNN